MRQISDAVREIGDNAVDAALFCVHNFLGRIGSVGQDPAAGSLKDVNGPILKRIEH